MFGDSEGLKSEVKFAVAAAYEKFAKQWGLSSEKLSWVDTWSDLLSTFTVAEINAAADHCVREFLRPPVPVEFIELATRFRLGKPISDPIVSKVERMAYLILSSKEFSFADITESELSDACLIAAAITHLKSYAAVLPDADPKFLQEELSGRARMFAAEASDWKTLAEHGKGYWVGAFLPGHRGA